MNASYDVCPECGARRIELVVAPGRFFCRSCGVAGPGPNGAPHQQMTIDECIALAQEESAV